MLSLKILLHVVHLKKTELIFPRFISKESTTRHYFSIDVMPNTWKDLFIQKKWTKNNKSKIQII